MKNIIPNNSCVQLGWFGLWLSQWGVFSKDMLCALHHMHHPTKRSLNAISYQKWSRVCEDIKRQDGSNVFNFKALQFVAKNINKNLLLW